MGPFRLMGRGLKTLWTRPNAVPPYGMLGAAYDHMMGHVDYEGWAEYIQRLMAHYGQGRRLLDGGCGTGRLIQSLEALSFRVTGFDRSRSMVRQAHKSGLGSLAVADVTAMPFKPGWDAVLCLYDTLLYLDDDQVRRTAAQAEELLRPGGLFIFDAVTEGLVLDYWRRFRERGRHGEWAYWRQSWYERSQRVQHTRIRLRHRPTGRLWTEHHRQRIFPLDHLAALVAASGLVRVGLFHEMTLEPGSESSGRVHFVYRREDR